MGIVIPRPQMRSRERRTIEARLRAYDDALKSGFTREEAMREAKSLTARKVAKAHKVKQQK